MNTQHSIKRAKERLGMNKKTAEHLMRNVIERGKDKSMFTSEEKRQWLLAKESSCGYKALVYNSTCFIVSPDNKVITLYPLPHWFTKAKRYTGKERIRNRAKFEKYNGTVTETGWIM